MYQHHAKQIGEEEGQYVTLKNIWVKETRAKGQIPLGPDRWRQRPPLLGYFRLQPHTHELRYRPLLQNLEGATLPGFGRRQAHQRVPAAYQAKEKAGIGIDQQTFTAKRPCEFKKYN